LHEGVDTALACPDANARFQLPLSRRILTGRDEVVTYVARNLEPYRGFHIFMRSLPRLLRRRPRAQVVIVGGDGVSYGAPPAPRSSYREIMLKELGAELDLSRVHFLGMLDHQAYLNLLQVSAAHVYLTYPFVLSWSLIEAMACGCLIVGSATPPVLEVLRDGENGFTVDFFDHQALAERIAAALASPEDMRGLRAAARATALARFDLKRVLLPRWMALFDADPRRDADRRPRPRPRPSKRRGILRTAPQDRATRCSGEAPPALISSLEAAHGGSGLGVARGDGLPVECQRRGSVALDAESLFMELGEGDHCERLSGTRRLRVPVRRRAPIRLGLRALRLERGQRKLRGTVPL
jgi:hypothetical protein